MRVTSLGFRTDLALRVLEGAEVTDRGDYRVIRTADNPGFHWGNFLLLAAWPAPGTGDAWLARFAAEFPAAGHVALGMDITDGPRNVVRRLRRRRAPARAARSVRRRPRAGPVPGCRDRPGGPPPGARRDAGLARGPLRGQGAGGAHARHRGRRGGVGHRGLPRLRVRGPREPAQLRAADRRMTLSSVTTAVTSSA